MRKETQKKDEVLEIEDLRLRLDEAEEALRAIRRGEIDALVVSTPQGDRVFTLKSADYPYRVFIEAMHEGAVTLGPDGTILYCNQCFSELIQTPPEKLIGLPLQKVIEPLSRDTFESAFRKRQEEDGRAEVYLKGEKGPPVLALLSFNVMGGEERVLTCVVVTDLRERKQAEEVLAQSERQMRSLAVQLLEVQEKERKRISLEIHDALGSSLAAIKYNMENLALNVSQLDLATLTDSIKAFIPMVKDIIGEVRRLQSDLRPSILDDLGILATLSWFCRRFQTIYSNIHVESKFQIKEEEVPDPIKITIFRICQEAFNNIAKHAQGGLVHLSLQRIESRIELTIEDNGKGFDPESLNQKEELERGVGLSSMKQRAEMSGGRFQLISSPGQGTVVRALWPYN